MLKRQAVLIVAAVLTVAGSQAPAQALPRFSRPFQVPRGDTVTPAYEGWYRNQDGTISVSFGYYNRNSEEILEIPIGPDNRLEPESVAQAQPEVFQPGRHPGTFSVTIPEGYRGEVWWTLRIRGEQVSIPSNLGAEYRIDALGPTIMGNTPPRVRFSVSDEASAGPGGQVTGPLYGKVGAPVRFSVWLEDDGLGNARGGERDQRLTENAIANLGFSKFRGPGQVVFADPSLQWVEDDNRSTKSTTAIFDTPGRYRIRALASDVSGTSGAEQCCWTNSFIDVEIVGSADVSTPEVALSVAEKTTR